MAVRVRAAVDRLGTRFETREPKRGASAIVLTILSSLLCVVLCIKVVSPCLDEALLASAAAFCVPMATVALLFLDSAVTSGLRTSQNAWPSQDLAVLERAGLIQ